MARQPRLAVAGLPHLVAQQGHPAQAVFVDDADRQAYLLALREALRSRQVALHAYHLGPGAVHLLLTPAEPAALSLALQDLGRRYGLAYNRRHGGSGTLWRGRFRAAPLQPERWALPAMVQVERAAAAEPPAWSSRAHHLGMLRDVDITDLAAWWQLGNTPFERESRYAALLDEGLPTAAAQQLQQALASGRALGDAAWLAPLAQQLARPLQARPRGRPRKPLV